MKQRVEQNSEVVLVSIQVVLGRMSDFSDSVTLLVVQCDVNVCAHTGRVATGQAGPTFVMSHPKCDQRETSKKP